jgi:hypothetical protein
VSAGAQSVERRWITHACKCREAYPTERERSGMTDAERTGGDQNWSGKRLVYHDVINMGRTLRHFADNGNRQPASEFARLVGE